MGDKLTATDYKKKNTRERRVKDREHLNHLKRLVENIRWWRSSAGSYDENGNWTDDPEKIAYYKKYWRGKLSKGIKKECNDAVRRRDDELFQGGSYKKVGEFWWTLW